ncbi:EAL domain-containing response regulator [Catenovulum sp. 2E275]|uniref:EAL domain-containing response regulator n=1 Tax=Catenovulum sp. 2E275 TaxID=2980497 RepID=UPI0021CE25A2|nr:EAL domain-containing response regulator [Catenovulum sp. 2E275]MCU4675827.1 EAL domain-containing response regulator [Catenovulum sp. 2E275]
MRKILVVDDDELINEFITDAAELIGVSTTAVTNGTEIQSVNLNQFEHILLDLSIPGADGVQLLRWLKNKNYKGAVSITSGCEPSVLNSAQQIGQSYGLKMHSPLVKPFPLERLLNVLQDDEIKPQKPIKAHRATQEQVDLLPLLRGAIKKRTIEVYYQPKFDIHQLHIVGVEALARWKLQDGIMIPPPIFIELAEKHHLIDELTHCIIGEVLPQLREWININPNFKVAINLSAFSLNNLDFPDYLAKQVALFQIKNKNIVLELTESALAEDAEKSAEILTRLRVKGFGLSIDDFGTGYSSIQQLQDIPFNELKIDKSFTANYFNRPQVRTIIESTIEMAHKLGIHVVAEGIEDMATLDYLKSVNCDQGQGFYYAKPMPASEFDLWIHNHPEFINSDNKKVFKQKLLLLSSDSNFKQTIVDTLNIELDIIEFSDLAGLMTAPQLNTGAVILVDVESTQDGFTAFEQLNEIVGIDKSLMIASGTDDKSLKLNAFSAGCEDYIVKTDSVGQLLAKFRVIKQFYISRQNNLDCSLKNQSFTTYSELEYYRLLIKLFTQLMSCKNKNEFVEYIFEFSKNLGWQICLKADSIDGEKSYRAPGILCSPMEDSAFTLLKDAGQIYHFNQRVIVNAKHFRMIIKSSPNMTQSWFDDFCINMIVGLEKKWRELNQLKALLEMCDNLEGVLSKLKKKVSKFEQGAHQIIDELLLDIRANLLSHSADENLEQKLVDLVESSVAQVLTLGEDGREIEIEFSHIITQYKNHHFDS